ncbi:MAG: hypothetical protein IJ721_01105 [Bacteroidales bacterium]|nr:hypothetical protein [Bacteroidales bacterium]
MQITNRPEARRPYCPPDVHATRIAMEECFTASALQDMGANSLYEEEFDD